MPSRRIACSALLLLLTSVPLPTDHLDRQRRQYGLGRRLQLAPRAPGGHPQDHPHEPGGRSDLPDPERNGTAAPTIEAGRERRRVDAHSDRQRRPVRRGNPERRYGHGDRHRGLHRRHLRRHHRQHQRGGTSPRILRAQQRHRCLHGSVDPNHRAFTYRNITLSKGGAASRVRLTGDTITNTSPSQPGQVLKKGRAQQPYNT
ncbi:MAG: hypothetical protein M0C28_37615 [Candidatus Moduliflexus flocculans]|nr:hypothetical protein [Candidatus Moduliflexus flocculans]